MDETIVFKNLKTKTKKLFVFIIVLAILLNIAYCFLGPIQEGIYYYEEHVINDEHYYECYNEKGQKAYDKGDWSWFATNDPSIYTENCKYKQFDSALACGIAQIFDYWLFDVIVVTSICLVIVVICICCICLTRCKFNVTPNNIYGKKGAKKFDIAFKDIVELTQKRKGIIIKTADKKLNVSPLKNCDEIYKFIKPYVPERIIAQQSTGTVDDIKLF